MPELSLQNIDQISIDIKNQEIVFSHLPEDLIDHVCCDIEEEMQKGLSFPEAYRIVKKKIGSGRRLKEIQEETLYAVDTKYRKMKNTMKISGVIGTVLLGIASLLKIMHWPGAGPLLTLGAVTLAFVFLPSALSVLWKETKSTKRIFLYISAFLAGMSFLMGILFKVQHWPGAGLIITFAGFCLLFLFIPALLIDSLKNPEKKIKRPVYILGALGFICYEAGIIFRIQHWPGARLISLLGLLILFFLTFPWYTWLTWKEEKSIKAEFIFLVTGALAIVIPGMLITLSTQ